MADVRPVWADRIRTERMKRGWDKAEMRRRLAQAAGDARGGLPDSECLRVYIQRWERGTVGISERYRMLYAAAFEMAEDELFADEVNADEAALPDHVGIADAGGSVVGTTVPTHAEDDMERRLLLRLAAMGLGAGVLGAEALRRLVDLALTAEPRDLQDWHLACDDHLHAVRTRPPAQVRDDLIVDLLALDRQMAAPGVDAVEMHRVRAALATLHANVLTRLGDHGAAIRWWRTASASADASGDLELRLAVRATEAGYGLRSGQRRPATVLRLTQNAQQIAGSGPSLGLALVVCSAAKTLSVLGRHDEARQELNTCRDLFAAEPGPPGIMPGYWQGGQLAITENTVHASAGDEDDAGAARGHALAVLAVTGDVAYTPVVDLHEALCTVVNGGAEEGARHATEIISSLPPNLHTSMILETGRMVLRAVPLERRGDPAVRDLRALTAGAPLR